MANFYTDIPELKYHLNNPMMERICQLKERDYRDKDEFDYAPQDYADAMDSYDKILEITGEITGETIAPNAEGVDEEGSSLWKRTCGICFRNQAEPRRYGKSRTEWYDHASSLRWLELPHHPVHHVRGNCCRCRCGIRKHLVFARLYRNAV